MKTKKQRGDFYGQVNTRWIKTHKIPKNESSINCFSMVEKQIKVQLRNLFKRMKTKNSKIERIYHSFQHVDENMVILQIVNLTELFLNSSDNIAKMLNISSLHLIKFPFQISVTDDMKYSRQQSLTISESTLTLPDFSMYIKDTKQIKNKFITFVKTIFEVIFGPSSKNKYNPETVWEVEKRLSTTMMKPEDQTVEKLYNKYTHSNLKEKFPSFNFIEMCELMNITTKTVIITNPIHFRNILKLCSEKILMHTYLVYQTILTYSFFHTELRRVTFEFLSKQLNGIQKQESCGNECYTLLQQTILNVDINREYWKEYQNSEEIKICKTMCKKLVDKLIFRIRNNKYLHHSTILKSIEKVKKIVFYIGTNKPFPCSFLQIVDDNDKCFDNPFVLLNKFTAFSREKMFLKLKTKQRSNEWSFEKYGNLFEVNAYYSQSKNIVVIPNGILQHPFVNKANSLSHNLAFLGTTIGHELFHAIDEEGCKFDAEGNYKNWWSKGDMKAYKIKQGYIVKQYELYAWKKDGIKLNGHLTLSENIADIGGLLLAEMVLLEDIQSLSPTLKDSHLKTFFIAYAKQWRTIQREEELKLKVAFDPHALHRYRTNCVLIHSEHFRRLFPEESILKEEILEFFW